MCVQTVAREGFAFVNRHSSLYLTLGTNSPPQNSQQTRSGLVHLSYLCHTLGVVRVCRPSLPYITPPCKKLVSIVDNVIVNHTKTAQEAAAEAAEAAKNEALIDAAQLVSVGRGAGEEGASSSAGAGDLGGSSSEVLEDVRR